MSKNNADLSEAVLDFTLSVVQELDVPLSKNRGVLKAQVQELPPNFAKMAEMMKTKQDDETEKGIKY
jgi:hypothetical protein